MLTNDSKTRRAVAVLMLAVAGFYAPAYAESVQECQENVVELCAETLEDCNWYEAVAVGFTCSLMLAGCSLESLSISVT